MNFITDVGNNWGDKIWGQVNGQGRNLLGQILMEVREEIKERDSIQMER